MKNINVSLMTMHVQQEKNVVTLLMKKGAMILSLLIPIKDALLSTVFAKKFINLANFMIQKQKAEIKKKLIVKKQKNILLIDILIFVINVFSIKKKTVVKKKN